MHRYLIKTSQDGTLAMSVSRHFYICVAQIYPGRPNPISNLILTRVNNKRAEDFSEMFESSARFNQDLGDWNVAASGINFRHTFLNASQFDQMLCWTWHENVYLLETFTGTACDQAGRDCNSCQPSSKPSIMPSVSHAPSVSREPSLLPSEEPSYEPTGYPTQRPTDVFTDECLAIVTRTPGTSNIFTMDYILELDLCTDPSLNAEETAALEGVVFDFLNAGASEACADNLNFMLVTLSDFMTGGSCAEGSQSDELSTLTFDVEGLGKNCIPHALPVFGEVDSGETATERKLSNFLQTLLLEAGFEDVSSVSPPEGITITSESEYQAFEIADGVDPYGEVSLFNCTRCSRITSGLTLDSDVQLGLYRQRV